MLDKTDTPLIPDAYIYLLGVQCLISIVDGLTGYGLPLYLAVQNPPTGSTEPVHVPGPLDPMTLPKPARTGLRTVRAMLNAGRSAHLVTLSFTTLSAPLLGDVLLQTLVRSAGCLTAHVTRSLLPPPRPHSHVAALDESQHASSALCLSVSIEGLHARFGGSWRRTTATRTLACKLGCLGALVPARACRAFPNRNAWLKLVRAMNCARDAERRRACASCVPPLGPLHITNTCDSIFCDVLGASVPHNCPHHVTPSRTTVPPRVVPGLLDESQHASSALRSPVSPKRLAFGLAGVSGGGAAPQSPRLGLRDLACLRAHRCHAWTLGSRWFTILEVLQNADYMSPLVLQ